MTERLKQVRGIASGVDEGYKLQSPLKLHGMTRAVSRIHKAIDQSETVLIFGDYDCDGITATAQMKRYFERRGITPLVRLPDRVKDGYGLTPGIVDELLASGCSLVITVDTGISASAETQRLQQNGIDVIITDHHAVTGTVPSAAAVVHPALSEDYASPHPSGAGVVFQLLRALEADAQWNGIHVDMALAMMGTVADIVPLQGDNRTIVRMGLDALSRIAEGPLHDLCVSAGVTPSSATATDVAFRLAPRINAAGRMDNPTIALQALAGDGEALETLNALNARRQDETHASFEKASGAFEDSASIPLLLSSIDPSYGHGVIGLIAGKLTEAHGRPSLVATVENGMCTASLRSPSCFDITKALREHAHLLQRYGGHAQAAGCTFAEEHADKLIAGLTESVSSAVSEQDLVPTISIDGSLRAADVSLRLCTALSRLEPFGEGNPEPVFALEDVTIEQARAVGKEGDHLQCTVDGHKAIAFGLGRFATNARGKKDIVAKVGIDTWRKAKKPQLFIVDIRDV